jgi:hypothetical protein
MRSRRGAENNEVESFHAEYSYLQQDGNVSIV